MRIISRTPIDGCVVLRGHMGTPLSYTTRKMLNLYIDKLVQAREQVRASQPDSLPAIDAHISKARAFAAGSPNISFREMRMEIDEICKTVRFT